jgi:hypothetical protein
MSVVEDALDITKQGKRMLLDVLPMRYLFDLIDAGLIALFGGWGLIDVYNELRTPVSGTDETGREEVSGARETGLDATPPCN